MALSDNFPSLRAWVKIPLSAGTSGLDREETMTGRTTAQVLGALGVCVTITVCTLYVTNSTAQNTKEGNASPIYDITIPDGYRDWRLISVNHLADTEGKLKQVRAQLGNDVAIKAFREGMLP